MAYTTIDDPGLFFNTKLYTGNGSTGQSITGVGFEPSLTWLKLRSTTGNHGLFDAVRGATKRLQANQTNAEDTIASFASFDSDGFTLSEASQNNSGETFASWNWKAGTSFTNDASATGIGTIDSSGSASDTSGFSIVSYTGTGSAGTIKHGLSSAPSMIIAKNRSATGNWRVYHKSLGEDYLIQLDLTGAALDNATWNDTAPTSSVFSISSVADVNGSGNSIIAYCFADVQGFSKFGSYTGNGSTDGTFVYTGFKPAFVIFKKTSSTANWSIRDNKRDPFNAGDTNLFANLSDVESSSNNLDFLSNGIKLRNAGSNWNSSSASYIFMAFAEAPFVTSTGVPATAR
jgi:hypothetical protein